MFKTTSPRGIKKEFTSNCVNYTLIDKFKRTYSSEIYHHPGNLWFKHRGLLHENLRQSYVFNISVS